MAQIEPWSRQLLQGFIISGGLQNRFLKRAYVAVGRSLIHMRFALFRAAHSGMQCTTAGSIL